MKQLFSEMLKRLRNGEDLVLCSIIASSGSTPRGSGAKMLVFKDGSTLGTIGGGAIEYESTKMAVDALSKKKTLIREYNLTANETADIGMVCGGKVVVFFQYFVGGDPEAISTIEYIDALFTREADAWLISSLSEKRENSLSVYEKGKGLLFADDLSLESLKPYMKSKGVIKKDEPSCYIEPLVQSGTVYIFGGGHVSQELVPVLSHVGFRVAVFEDRSTYAEQALFPNAEKLIVHPFQNIDQEIQLTPNDYVVIMTRGHQSDYDVLEQVMRHKVYYVGVIGSRHKKEHTFKQLVTAGIPASALSLIHTPIGLDIKGETPAEIAISIAAELIKSRAEKSEVFSL